MHNVESERRRTHSVNTILGLILIPRFRLNPAQHCYSQQTAWTPGVFLEIAVTARRGMSHLYRSNATSPKRRSPSMRSQSRRRQIRNGQTWVGQRRCLQQYAKREISSENGIGSTFYSTVTRGRLPRQNLRSPSAKCSSSANSSFSHIRIVCRNLTRELNHLRRLSS